VITVFDDDGNRLPLTYNGYTLNEMVSVESPAGMQGSMIAPVAYSSPVDFISEKLQWRDGIDVSAVTRSSRLIQLNGVIHGTTIADLKDRVRAFSHAFDAGWIAYANEDPFLPLAFSVPTTDTTTFPTGLVPSKVYVLPTETPMPAELRTNGRKASFRLTLLQRDPRRFLQTSVTHTSGTLTNPGDTTSWPIVSFSMSGAGSASFTLTNTAPVKGARSLVLDLSGRSNGEDILVDFERRQVYVDGTQTAGIFKSGDWWEVEPGTQTVSYANTSNTGTRTLTVQPAFSF